MIAFVTMAGANRCARRPDIEHGFLRAQVNAKKMPQIQGASL
jgi:hypothetical protein